MDPSARRKFPLIASKKSATRQNPRTFPPDQKSSARIRAYGSNGRLFQATPGFWLLAAWFALSCGWRMLLTVLAAAAIHEAGHCLALKALGARTGGLRAGVLGCVLEADTRGLSYGGELAAVLAGPGGSLLGAFLLREAGGGRWEALVGANLVLGAFNLLPIRPLDGGRALELLVSWLAGPAAGERAASAAGAASALALALALAAVMVRTRGSLWLLPPASAALAAAVRELRGGYGA